MAEPIRVLVVDDSAVVRRVMTEVLETAEDIRVIGTAADPFLAAEQLEREIPDVITLDIEMPRMDGLTFLRKLMRQYPLPVVICSSLAGEGAQASLDALEYGAVEIIHKPRLGARRFIRESKIVICDAVRAASRVKNPAAGRWPIAKKLTADVILPAGSTTAVPDTERLIVIGASTGGPAALQTIVTAMPPISPGIVVVQHMPGSFTKAFAQRLDGLCELRVKEAEHGDKVVPGQVLIAPGDRHLLLQRDGRDYWVAVKDGPLVSRHRPSVDVLFRSAGRYAGRNGIGVLLTGMGDDGAHGLLEMRRAGALTIAQDEESCVVYGMPREAVKLGAAHEILPIDRIAGRLCGSASPFEERTA